MLCSSAAGRPTSPTCRSTFCIRFCSRLRFRPRLLARSTKAPRVRGSQQRRTCCIRSALSTGGSPSPCIRLFRSAAPFHDRHVFLLVFPSCALTLRSSGGCACYLSVRNLLPPLPHLLDNLCRNPMHIRPIASCLDDARLNAEGLCHIEIWLHFK